MAKNQNPITAIQESYGLSDIDFARLLDVSVMTLRATKHGEAQHPKAILRGLVDIGFDSELVAREYTDWRREDRRRRLQEAV